MEIIVPLQVKVCLSEDETVPIEYFVRMLRDQRIEALLLERILNLLILSGSSVRTMETEVPGYASSFVRPEDRTVAGRTVAV
jgi:hypothetical protein